MNVKNIKKINYSLKVVQILVEAVTKIIAKLQPHTENSLSDSLAPICTYIVID